MAPETRDHIIASQDAFPESPIARWDANIRALRLVKELDAANRLASAEEQRELALYSGFGDSAFEQAFSPYGASDPAWKRRRGDLEGLVLDEQFEGIKRSRLNAFYTTPEIVQSMWKGLSAMGADKLENPKVLEPSAGSGRFLGLQPPEMARKSSRVAVELDPMTAGILKHLYPETKVFNAGFQDAPLPNDHFDIAISNVPFGRIKVYDKGFNATGRKHLTNSVHNYFFAKTLDKLRPGGVMAYVTSHYTMDSPKAEPVRRYLAEHADLLGAVRLPDDAFPDTDVVTDIIYLRKRAPGEEAGDDSWVKSETIDVPGMYGSNAKVPVSRYYIDNPDRVLGRHSTEGSMYAGATYTVKSTPEKPLTQTLTRETGEIARAGTLAAVALDSVARATAASAVKGPSKYVVEEGELRVSDGEDTVEASLPQREAERIRALVGLRDTARRLIQQESSASDHDTVERTRESLRRQYADYLDKHEEAINTPANRKLMGGDSDDHLLFALERYDKESECWQASDIMHKRMVGSVPTQEVRNASDAMSVVMNETGTLDFERMGEMLGRTAAEVHEELANEQLIFRSPNGESWIPATEYLSGNVREKLRQARVAASSDTAYRRHVEALEKVQPTKVRAEDISTPLGAPWIPADVINEWVHEHFRPYRNWRSSGAGEYFRYVDEGEAFVGQDAKGNNKRIGATGSGGSWTLAERINAPDAVMRSQWGTPQMSAKDILLRTLQGAPINVTKDAEGRRVPDQAGTLAAQEKAAKMQESFDGWTWEDSKRRERLEELFNDTHNASRPRVFDGSHQTFPGMALKWQQQMRPHQRDAIYRVVNDGTTLLAHEVGFGKSATMIAAAMERKRLGLANKPVFVVPKATHEQFVGQFMELYPGAKLLAPDESDFKAGNREQFLSRITTGEWDGVVLSSEQFERIPLSPQTEMKWIRQQRNEMAGSLAALDGDSRETRQTQKKIQQKIDNYETGLKELRDRMAERSDDAQTFETLGIDQIYVDEADRYKNLPYVTRMGAGRGGVKGLPQSESQRAWDMYMKIRYLQDKTGQKPDASFAKGGVVFATGTPVANTIAETWTMMRYLQPGELKRRGLESFDAWAKTYGEITSGIEQTAAGTYKPVQRFSKFVNLPELSSLFQNVADIRVASEVPEMQAAQPRLVDNKGENKRITVVSPPHDALKAYMRNIVERVDNLPNVEPEEDNMLKISSDARKAALDVRMVDPSAPYKPDGKIGMAARNIAEIYKTEAEDKGTQLVFLDMGTPKARDAKDDAPSAGQEDLTQEEQQVLTNVYKALRNELVAKSVPEDQVAFIHDHKTPQAREDLLDQVRRGDVRVLVGSTEKIGVGVNVQDRAAAAHHVDVPWRPRDVEQREGRIIRQGNKVYGPVLDKDTGARLSPGRGVKIFQYVQEGSFDGFMWQAVETKARAIKSLMKRHQTSRGMDDIDPFILGVAEAKALASGNPLVKRAEELKLKVNTGRMAREAHQKQVDEARSQIAALETQVASYRSVLPNIERDARYVESLPQGADFQATIRGQDYSKRAEAAAALEAALKEVKYDPDPADLAPIGVYRGFAVAGVNTDQGYQLVVAHPETQQPYHSGYVEKGEVKGTGLMSRLDNLVKGIPERANRTKDKLAEGDESLELYEEQIRKPFATGTELAHAEQQLRVIQVRLSDDKESLREGDDYEMNVMNDDWTRSAAPDVTPREAPDVDSLTLREAVEAVRSPEEADTPREVKQALVDELQAPAPVKAAESPAIPAMPEQEPSPVARATGEERVPESDTSAAPPDILANEPEPAVSLDTAVEKVQAKLKADRAYQNAIEYSDAQNIGIEREHALQRAMTDLLVEGEIDLFKQYSDDAPFRDRLERKLGEAIPKPTGKPVPTSESEKEPKRDPEKPKPTALEMLARAADTPVPLTGPGSVMERLEEESPETSTRDLAHTQEREVPEDSPKAEPDLEEPKVRYVLPSFVTGQYRKRMRTPKAKIEAKAPDTSATPTPQPVSEPAVLNELAVPTPKGEKEPEKEPEPMGEERHPAETKAKPTGKKRDSVAEEVLGLRVRELPPITVGGEKDIDRATGIRADQLQLLARHLRAVFSNPDARWWIDEGYQDSILLEAVKSDYLKAGAGRRPRSSATAPRDEDRIETKPKRAPRAMVEPASIPEAKAPEPNVVRNPSKTVAALPSKSKREKGVPKAVVKARMPASQVVIDEPLYQGHKGPGIGYLKPDLPERRDGDGDTVVAERKPRKADQYQPSPLPVPQRLTDKYARIAATLGDKGKARRPGRSRSIALLKTPSRTPSIKFVTRQ